MPIDAEQASLRNLLPTGLMQGTAAALVPCTYSAYRYADDLANAAATPSELMLTKLLVAAGVALSLTTLLAAEACWVLHKTREKRVITRYSNTHPYMSFAWLLANAEMKHLAAVGALSVVMVCIGVFLCEALH